MNLESGKRILSLKARLPLTAAALLFAGFLLWSGIGLIDSGALVVGIGSVAAGASLFFLAWFFNSEVLEKCFPDDID